MSNNLIVSIQADLNVELNSRIQNCNIEIYNATTKIISSDGHVVRELKNTDIREVKFFEEIKRNWLLQKKQVSFVQFILTEEKLPRILMDFNNYQILKNELDKLKLEKQNNEPNERNDNCTSEPKSDLTENNKSNLESEKVVNNVNLSEKNSQLELKRIEIEDKQEYNVKLKKMTLQNYSGLILYYYRDFKQTANFFENNSNFQIFNKLIVELNKRIYFDVMNNSLSWKKYRHPSYKKRVLSIFTNRELTGMDAIDDLDELFIKYDYMTLMEMTKFTNLFAENINDKYHIGVNLNGLYSLALAFNRILHIIESRNIISGDIELIINNLIDSKIVDDLEIVDKVYPIYSELEAEDGSAISIAEFSVLYQLFKQEKNQADLDRIYKIYEEEIDEYYNANKEINNKILLMQEIKKFVLELDFNSYFEIDMTSESSAIDNYLHAIEMIIYHLLKVAPIGLVYELLNGDFINQLANLVYKRDWKLVLLEEKKRLLSGNLNKEIRQYNKKIDYENITNGYDFEVYLGSLFEEMGYEVTITKKSGDQGADLIIEKNKVKTVVQAKFYSNPVGNKAIQEVVSAIAYYNASNGMVITNSTYTKSATELASVNNIELVDGTELKNIRNKLLISI